MEVQFEIENLSDQDMHLSFRTAYGHVGHEINVLLDNRIKPPLKSHLGSVELHRYELRKQQRELVRSVHVANCVAQPCS